jgi:hypothetical protein
MLENNFSTTCQDFKLNLICPSINYNLCFKYPNEEGNPTLNINFKKPFQKSKGPFWIRFDAPYIIPKLKNTL